METSNDRAEFTLETVDFDLIEAARRNADRKAGFATPTARTSAKQTGGAGRDKGQGGGRGLAVPLAEAPADWGDGAVAPSPEGGLGDGRDAWAGASSTDRETSTGGQIALDFANPTTTTNPNTEEARPVPTPTTTTEAQDTPTTTTTTPPLYIDDTDPISSPHPSVVQRLGAINTSCFAGNSGLTLPDDASCDDSNPSLQDSGDGWSPNAHALGRRVSHRKTGERRTFDFMATAYPATVEPAFARLLIALLSPHDTATDDDGNAVVKLSGPTLAACMGRERDYAEINLKGANATGAFLAAFRDAVLPDLEWTEFVPNERVRTVRIDHVRQIVAPTLVKLFDLDHATDPADMDERVYLDSGAAFNANGRSREHGRWTDALDGYDEHATTKVGARLWRLLASTPYRTFSRLPGRLGAAQIAAAGLETDRATADAQRALRDVADYPFPWYKFSKFSARLFPMNTSVASLAAPCRRALLSDSFEIDLASAHLAIIAAEWGCDELFAFLDSGESFWPLILEHMGVPYSEATKAAVKRGTYGLVYGAGDKRIVKDIRDEYLRLTGSEMPQETAERFLNHPLVAEVKAARDVQLRAIKKTLSEKVNGQYVGFVVDCFKRRLSVGQMEYGDGVKRPVRGPDAARSILSQRAQARELWLLEPVVTLTEAEYAKGSDAEWRLTCWSHDGFNVRFRRQRDAAKHLQAMQYAVAKRAASVGIPTRLEVKYDPTTLEIG